MEPWHFALIGAAFAVLGIGWWKRPKLRVFDDAALAKAKDDVAKQGFNIASYEHAPGGAVKGLGLNLDDRVVGSVTIDSASIVVHGMKPIADGATFRVGRRGLDAASLVTTGDAAFDEKHKVNGGPHEATRALLEKPGVKGAIAQLFVLDDVREVRVLSIGKEGGAVRVDAAGRNSLRVIATAARSLADAVDA